MPAELLIFSALSVCSKWKESHEANHPLSLHHLHRPNDNMGLRDSVRNFLSLPRKDRRARSEGRNEVGPTADPGGVGSGVPRPTESSPDLRIGPPTLPTPSPSTSRDQESNGTSTDLFRMIHLTTLRATQTATSILVKSGPFSKADKANTRYPQMIRLPTQVQHTKTSRVGNPPRIPQPS